MTKEALKKKLETHRKKTGVPFSFIAKKAGISRSSLYKLIDGSLSLEFEAGQKLIRYVEGLR